MAEKIFIASTLGNDPHTEGLHIAGKIAGLGGIKCKILPPSDNYEPLLSAIHFLRPEYIGLSYRLSPEKGLHELIKLLTMFINTGLVKPKDQTKIAFAGLPQTISLIRAYLNNLPLRLSLIESYPEIIDRITQVVDFFNIINGRQQMIDTLKQEIEPPGLDILNQIADEVVFNDNYLTEPRLEVPSDRAKKCFVTRIQEAKRPLIRTHFGIPSESIKPTVEGIKKIALAQVVDEISLGSSDLSQRYFGKNEMFLRKKNDGGVPYKDASDLAALSKATRFGNYPSIKPYAHVTDMVNFVDICLTTGMLIGAHQAVPLYWFNELDGRGPAVVYDSIIEHFEVVKKLAAHNLPVEMNDPNQWSSRGAHDPIIVADYGLISAVMTSLGVNHLVLQFQFNKPRETGDFGDLAKMTAGLSLAQKICKKINPQATILRQTRTGIEYLSPDLKKAKWQLARSTLLQMFLKPHIIHMVSYCEAEHAATAEDVIESSKIVRKAVKLFHENETDLLPQTENFIIQNRKRFLLNEAEYLLKYISTFNPNFSKNSADRYRLLADPITIFTSIEKKIMTAPGIVLPQFKGDFTTRPTKYGFIDNVDDHGNLITEETRLTKMHGLLH